MASLIPSSRPTSAMVNSPRKFFSNRSALLRARSDPPRDSKSSPMFTLRPAFTSPPHHHGSKKPRPPPGGGRGSLRSPTTHHPPPFPRPPQELRLARGGL